MYPLGVFRVRLSHSDQVELFHLPDSARGGPVKNKFEPELISQSLQSAKFQLIPTSLHSTSLHSTSLHSTPLAMNIITLTLSLALLPTTLAQDAQTNSNNSSTSALPSNLLNLTAFNPSANSTANQSSTSNPASNLRIPTTISATCQKYLTQLNSNPNITACTAPLLNATTSFSSGPKSVTHAQVKNTFDGLCGPNSGSGCAPHMMYTILNQFASSCSQELQTGVQAVRMVYDVLYILTPYRIALCSKDPTTGDYCPSVIASSVVNGTSSKSANMNATDFGAMVNSVFGGKLVTQLGSSSPSPDHPVLQTRDLANSTNSTGSNPTNQTTSTSTQAQNIYNPNADAYASTNLVFLFLSPYLPDSALCQPCSQSVMAAYIGFEQATPHYGGLSSSSYLSGQLKLWKAISSRCGEKFVEAINNEAGVMSILTTTSAAASAFIRAHFNSLSLLSLFLISLKYFELF